MCDGMICIFGEDDGVYTPRWIGGNIIEVDTLLTMLSDRWGFGYVVAVAVGVGVVYICDSPTTFDWCVL